MTSIPLYVCASTAFFVYFATKISPFISKSIPIFAKLQEKQKAEWHNRNASTVHSIIVTFISIYVLLFDESLHHDLVWGGSSIAVCNISITVGYFIADIYFMITQYEAVGGSVAYLVHHCISAYAYIYSLSAGVLLSVATFRLLAELSTPFVNLRWCLHITSGKNGKLYFWNGVVMTGTFFISRIVTMPLFYYMVPIIVNLEAYKRVNTSIHLSWIGTCVVLDVLNIGWFYKMASGILKHINTRAKGHQVDICNTSNSNENGSVTKAD